MMVQYESMCMSHKRLVRIGNKVMINREQKEDKKGCDKRKVVCSYSGAMTVPLDMSWVAMTLMLRMLYLKLALQILSESRWFVGIGVVQGCEGMGDIPGI